MFEKIKSELVLGNYDKCLEMLSEIEENELGEKNYLLGVVYAGRKNYGEAEKLLLKSLEINKNHIGAYLTLSELYNVQEQYEKAREILKKANTLDPDNINIITYLAGLEMHLKEYKDAIFYIRKVLKDNDDIKIRNLLVKALESKTIEEIENGYYDEVKYNAEEMISLNDEYAGAYKLLGLYYNYMQDYEAAAENFIKAFQRSSNDIDIINYLTASLIKIGDIKNAKISNEYALAIEPENGIAKEYKLKIDDSIY